MPATRGFIVVLNLTDVLGSVPVLVDHGVIIPVRKPSIAHQHAGTGIGRTLRERVSRTLLLPVLCGALRDALSAPLLLLASGCLDARQCQLTTRPPFTPIIWPVT